MFPLSSFFSLLTRFRYELEEPGADPLLPENLPWIAFCRAAFSLIAFGGLAWPGSFSDIASLRWRDVSTAACGFIKLPRAGGWQRIFVEPVVAICALSLGIQLARLTGKGTPDPETPLLILADGKLPPENEVGEKIPWARRCFNTWLAGLCERAGVKPITLGLLAGVARVRLQAMAGNVVAGLILGQTLYNPCPDDQFEDISAYRSEVWPMKLAPSQEIPVDHQEMEMSGETIRRSIAPDRGGPVYLERLLRELRDAFRPFLRASYVCQPKSDPLDD
jgi:hypothetical protein